MKTSVWITTLGLCLTMAACGGTVDRLRPGGFDRPVRSERVSFDGFFFRSRVRHTSEDRRNFSVEVRKAEGSLKGAVEAAQFEATKYCLGVAHP